MQFSGTNKIDPYLYNTKENKDVNNINEEICSLLDSIKPATTTRDKSKQFFKNKQLETIPEDKVKTSKVNALKGLTDNILNDYETKDKARKGLMYLLNRMSGNTFCPEIREYFEELKENHIVQKENMNRRDSGKKIIDLANNKSLKRQNFIEKFDPNVAGNKDLKKDKSNEEDIFKINFRPSNKGKATLTVLKNNEAQESNSNNITSNAMRLTFSKKRTKTVNKQDKFDNNYFQAKAYKNDIIEKELFLYYSDEEVENTNKFLQNTKKKPTIKRESISKKKRKKIVKFKELIEKSHANTQIQTLNEKSSKFKGPSQKNIPVDINQLKNKYPNELSNINEKNKNLFRRKLLKVSTTMRQNALPAGMKSMKESNKAILEDEYSSNDSFSNK
jgi:hypothetical protein